MRTVNVAVTGATGFIGRRLVGRLLGDGHRVRALARSPASAVGPPGRVVIAGLSDDVRRWRDALAGVDVVIHLAARTHRIRERGRGDLEAYRAVNRDGTSRVAEAAAREGVGRIVFVSSIKVNGERTSSRPFVAQDRPAPEDAYGISKWEAEQSLKEIADAAGVESVVVRPPMVYGPGAKGNFARLCRAVRGGWPLPLGAVENRRSLVALDNLVDLLAQCAVHPAAAGQTFLVSDNEDLSTPELVRRLAKAMRRNARLLPISPVILCKLGALTGRSAELARLLESLQVDISHTCSVLEWKPPVTVQHGLEQAVAGLT